ncbi:MAG: ASCH domain-containing protein [Desulfomonilaceae bacterium]
MTDVLISIKPKYVNMILSGDKSVEIRNRPVKLQAGTRLWIYSTLPKGRLEAVALVDASEVDTPSLIWKHYSDRIGLSWSTFQTYVNGSKQVSAILLKDVSGLVPSLTLSDLRSEIEKFTPPQFLKRIESTSAFFNLLGNKGVRLAGLSNGPITSIQGYPLD